jgi:predicted DNA-binding protein with PD1-like motif
MGIKIWLVAEVVITELLDTTASRVRDHNGFELLWP